MNLDSTIAPVSEISGDGIVHVYRVDLESQINARRVVESDCLDEDEKARAARLIRARHRHRYRAGRTWVKTILADYLECAPSNVEFSQVGNGKPVLRGNEIEFNLSHSGPSAVLAVSRIGPVGIDVERLDRVVNEQALAKKYFGSRERQWLAQARTESAREAFFQIWTAKEARMKVFGDGFSLPARDIDLTFSGREVRGYAQPAEPVVHLRPVQWPDNEIVCTVASSRAIEQVRLMTRLLD